jgi:CubicO group peptidase (beta-lactamase class C family)
MFSGSKAALAMLIHKLAERRQVRLNDPLCHYVPEFGSNGKDRITIHHALTHTAGIPRPRWTAIRCSISTRACI